MATDNTYTNSVPLGQAGTGSAFLLGESQAANRYLQEQDYQRRLAEQQRQRDAQQLAQDWQRNALKVEGGLYWNNEFNTKVNDHIQKGIQLRNMGVNPYGYNTDPMAQKAQEEYLLERAQIQQDMDTRKSYEAQLNNGLGLIRKNPEDYEPEDIAAYNNIISGTFSDALKNGIPTLRKRYNPLAVVQKVQPSQSETERVVGNQRIKTVGINKENTLTSIESALAEDPQSKRWVMSVSGGYTIPELRNIPNTLEEVVSKVVKEYDGNPDKRTELAKIGITNKNTPAFREYVNAEANKRFSAKQNWNDTLQNLYQSQWGKVKPVDRVLNDFSARNMQLREQSNARAQTRFNERGQDDVDEDVYYTNEFMDRVFEGARTGENTGTGEQLGGILEGKGYSTSWKLSGKEDKKGEKTQTKPYHVERFTSNGAPTGKMKITLAPRTIVYKNDDGDNVVRNFPSRSITIDANNENNDRSRLNSFLKEATAGSLGLKESQIRTNQASGKIRGTQPSKQTSTNKNQGMVTMVLPNGSSGQIPANKVADFLKKYPQAKRQ